MLSCEFIIYGEGENISNVSPNPLPTKNDFVWLGPKRYKVVQQEFKYGCSNHQCWLEKVISYIEEQK